MQFFVEYKNVEEISRICEFEVETYMEILLLGKRKCIMLALEDSGVILNSLFRTYIVDESLTDEEIWLLFSRYSIDDNKKEKNNMGLVKEKIVVDMLKDESSSYSDDSLFNITSFGTDMSFRELITMYEEGDLEKPEMQRNYVWDRNEASRFIDSILLGLPIPSIFLAKTEDEKRLIVDGYQRIMTVYDYVKRGIFGGDNKSFSLSNSENINERWRGRTFLELKEDEQRKIRNSPIHAIVFEQKEPKDDTGMYQIFERINTSGRSLKPQEIRNCVYHGEFNQMLILLNRNKAWRKIYNSSSEEARMADVELVLRMFAFSYLPTQKEAEQKQINLVKYLNVFMKRNNNFQLVSCEELETQFTEIIAFLEAEFDMNIFRNGRLSGVEVIFSKKINPAIVDAIYSATNYVRKLNKLDEYKNKNLNEQYKKLILNEKFQDAVSKRTTNMDKIKLRTSLAVQILYGEVYE